MSKQKTAKDLELEIAQKNYEIEINKIELKYLSQKQSSKIWFNLD